MLRSRGILPQKLSISTDKKHVRPLTKTQQYVSSRREGQPHQLEYRTSAHSISQALFQIFSMNSARHLLCSYQCIYELLYGILNAERGVSGKVAVNSDVCEQIGGD